ncbi:hypothetical protein ACYZUA_11175 [Pseudomonas sp. LS2P72]
MYDPKLLSEICSSDAVFWGGRHPPIEHFTASTRLFEASYDFRESSDRHGNYSAVYLTELDIGQIKQWPLVLDEALRLLDHNKKSSLFLRFTQSNLISVFLLTTFLRRRTDFKFELIYQEQDPDGTFVYALNCFRLSIRATLSTFEFALITNGKRPNEVKAFIDSVSSIRGIDNIAWTIAICGPIEFGATIDNKSGKIRYIEEPKEHGTKGWITRKKNLIVETSSAENLLIAHDRYEIPPTFLDAMFEYGADFSVIVPAQYDRNGDRFPDWVSIGSQWSWAPCGMLEHGDYNPNIYVNGGVIISKREVLIASPWNNLLFWNQGEDVELTRSMSEKGVTPRFARHVELIVTDARPGYTYDFASIPQINNVYVSPNGSPLSDHFTIPPLAPGKEIDLRNVNPTHLAHFGIYASPSLFGYTSYGLVPKRKHAVISISAIQPVAKYTHLNITITSESLNNEFQISINGTTTTFTTEHLIKSRTKLTIDLTSKINQNCRNIVIALHNDDHYAIESIGTNFVQVESAYPLLLSSKNMDLGGVTGSGWSERESWGVWSVGATSSLTLPKFEIGEHHDLNLVIKAISFAPKSVKSQLVAMTCEGTPIGILRIPKNKRPKKFNIRVPGFLIQDKESISIQLNILHLSSPKKQGISLDARELGIGVVSIDANKISEA